MTLNEREQLLKELAKMPQGRALKEYLTEEISKLNDISSITSFEELIGKQLATKIFKETLRFLDSLAENKLQKGSNQYV